MNTKITSALIYTPDGLITGDICITDDRITAVGTAPEGFIADKVISGSEKMVIPGLINAHTHIYMSVFRNLADDLSFDDWLFGNILPREDRLDAEQAYKWSCLSCEEMIRTGTTTFMSMNIFPNADSRAAHDFGMRAVITRGLVGEDRNDEGGIRRLNEHLRDCELYKDDPLISFKLGPHAIYSCGEDYLMFLIEKAKELHQDFHIHLSESRREVEDCIKKTGKTPVRYLYDMGFFDIPTCAAHCVHITDEDMDIFKEKNVSVLHNPKSNLKLANGIAPVKKLLEKGVNVCIGTDSQASNNALNMFSEMNFAALLQKGVYEDPIVCSADEVLKMATINGAKALGMDKDIGEIVAGKKADLVIIDLNSVNLTPKNDMVAALVYSSNGSEVNTVMIDGKVVMEEGRLVR